MWGSTTIPDGLGGTTSSPYGVNNILGNAALENDVIAFLKLHRVNRVYGSFGNKPDPAWPPATDHPKVAAWNEKLACVRIQSQLLLEAISVSAVDDTTDILDKITRRFIDFNDLYAAESDKQFKALHLDIEPQQTPPYSGGSAADKRAVLDDLFDTYAAIRAHLDANSYPGTPIYADIPFTWDKIPGSIGWADPADRDAWFTSLTTVLDGITIMTFSKDTAPELDVATAYERGSVLPVLDGFARIAIQPKVGVLDPPTIIWPDYPTFNSALNDLEALVEEDETTDLENLGLWRHAIDSTGLGYTLRNRGLWFWEGDPYDTIPSSGDYHTLAVVGDAVEEDEAISFMTARQVKRLFGQYTGTPFSDPATIAAWNTKLHVNCIDSESLFYGNFLHSPALKPEMLNNIQMAFIDYLDLYPGDLPAQFDALRLHLAPQHAGEWDFGTSGFRRTQLDNVLDILTDTRALLDSSGYPHIPLFADISPLWDLLPVSGGEVGWADATDRDNWYAALHEIVDGVSLTSFDQDNLASIDSVTAYERTGILPTKVRVGMRSAVGPGETWTTIADYDAERELVENTLGAADTVDIDSYAHWREAIKTGGPPPVIGVTLSNATAANPVLTLEGVPGHLYIVRFAETPHLLHIAPELMRLRNTSPQIAPLRINIPTTTNQGFWLIERVKD